MMHRTCTSSLKQSFKRSFFSLTTSSMQCVKQNFRRVAAASLRDTTRTSQCVRSSPTYSLSAARPPRGQPLSSRCVQLRQFTSSGARYEDTTRAKTSNRTGVRMATRAALFIGTGAVMVFYFQYEKKRLERKRIVEMSKGYGKPKVGGPFNLRDLDGKEFTEKDLLGKYTLIYFGFSHCPDICPDELDKMAEAIDIVQKQAPNTLRSVFITCDPARDTPKVLRSYLAEFHPSLIGLTGTWEQTKDVCKQYRVYFSTPPSLVPGEEDYLVDHSIYFYVMDPEGDFVECIGRQDTPESAAAIVLEHIKDWRREKKPIDTTPLTYLNINPASPTTALQGATAAA